MKYLKSLDSIRAFAVILVLFGHFLPRHNIRTPLGVFEQLFIPTGSFAVTLFFVLSGFLITSILLHDKEMNSNRLLIVKNFVIRRTLRIFPVYYLLLVVMVIVRFPFYFHELRFQFSFTSNVFIFRINEWTHYLHTWSLAVEEQFYLLWPWLIIFVSERRYLWMFWILIFITIASAIYIAGPNGYFLDSTWHVLLNTSIGAFGVGGLYAWLNRFEEGRLQIKRLIPYVFGSALLLAISWKLSPYFSIEPVMGYLIIIVKSILSIGIIHYVMGVSSGLMYVLFANNKWLHFVGKISYGIYLFHIPIQYLFKYHLINRGSSMGIPNNPYMWFFLYLIVVVAISYLSYELFEKRFLKLKRHFSFTKS